MAKGWQTLMDNTREANKQGYGYNVLKNKRGKSTLGSPDIEGSDSVRELIYDPEKDMFKTVYMHEKKKDDGSNEWIIVKDGETISTEQNPEILDEINETKKLIQKHGEEKAKQILKEQYGGR